MVAVLDYALIAMHFSVALVTGTVAVAFLVADPRRNWNQWLAFFLLLVCGNYALNGLNVLVHVSSGSSWVAWGSDATWEPTLRGIAFLFLIFDPAVLAYFASIFPRRTVLARTWWGPCVLAVPVLAFTVLEVLGGHVSRPDRAWDPVRASFFAYLVACYVYATWRLLANFTSEPSSVMRTQVKFVALGAMVAFLPRVPLVTRDLYRELNAIWLAFGEGPGRVLEFLVRATILWALLWAAHAWLTRRASSAKRERESRDLVKLTAAAFAVFTGLWFMDRLPTVLHHSGFPVSEGLITFGIFMGHGPMFAARWFVFAGAIAYGMLRFQILATNLRAIGGVAAAGVSVLAFVLGALGHLAFGPWVGAAASSVLFAGVLVGVYRVVWWHSAAERSQAHLRERAMEVYRAMLAATLAEGPLDEKREGVLERARKRLDISPEAHHMMLAIAQMENEGGAREVVLGRYVIAKRLGAGGYATVHLAQDREDGNPVVIKRFRDAWTGRGARDAALRELEVARRVSHSNVIAMHDLVPLEDGAIVVMEFADGGSIRDLLDGGDRVPSKRAAEIVAQVLDGLQALHEAGIVHGDVKPENVLVTADGTVKLADFGTARVVDARVTLVADKGDVAPGTIAYMAPEQARGEGATKLSDVYAVGLLAFEILTGRPYVSASSEGPYGVLQRVAEGGTPALGDVPPAWRAFLEGALAAEPSRRYASVREMRDALAAVDGGSGVRGPAGGRGRTWLGA